jgi:alkylated DNA repair dioxygenase AlkB
MLHLNKYFTLAQQQALVELTRNIASINGGMTVPVMPSGHKFNCSQTSCGLVGWVSDRDGSLFTGLIL